MSIETCFSILHILCPTMDGESYVGCFIRISIAEHSDGMVFMFWWFFTVSSCLLSSWLFTRGPTIDLCANSSDPIWARPLFTVLCAHLKSSRQGGNFQRQHTTSHTKYEVETLIHGFSPGNLASTIIQKHVCLGRLKTLDCPQVWACEWMVCACVTALWCVFVLCVLGWAPPLDRCNTIKGQSV